jgi:hypothetical protein
MSEAATTYTPRPGSKAEQAAMHLQARGELSTAELSDAIDCESGTLHALLAVPVKYGYLAREKRDGITRWRMGDGTPLPAEPDDDPPVQRIVSAAHAPKKSLATRAPHARSAKPARAKQAARANKAKATPLAIATPPPPKTAGAPSLSCAVFNTGELLLEVPGQAPLRLDGRQTADLLRWLQRVQPTIASEPA